MLQAFGFILLVVMVFIGVYAFEHKPISDKPISDNVKSDYCNSFCQTSIKNYVSDLKHRGLYHYSNTPEGYIEFLKDTPAIDGVFSLEWSCPFDLKKNVRFVDIDKHSPECLKIANMVWYAKAMQHHSIINDPMLDIMGN